MTSAGEWAEAEFGSATLGDERRTRRLVRLATDVASRPAGMVPRVCESSAAQEGAFRWLENAEIRHEPVLAAIQRATAARCAEQQLVFVPIDATSLTLTDKGKTKGLGGVGAWQMGSRGVQVMTALAVCEQGTPLGICAQHMWIRERPSKKGSDKESRFWIDVLLDAHEKLAAAAPECRPWYQLDRGADWWPVLGLASERDLLLTVRAAYDRKLEGRESTLWQAVSRSPVVAYQRLFVPAKAPRRKRRRIPGKRIYWTVPATPPREAKLAVRASRVALAVKTSTGRQLTVEINAVYVREVGRCEDDRVEWMLLTTHPIHTASDVLRVVRGYGRRWRIEDFHRTWKRGLCRVEDTQLRSRNAIFKWATLLATVASRALHLAHLARSTPDAPALGELTRYELEALITLRQPKNTPLDYRPTLAQAVRWLADLGGYAGPWNGPPGQHVVARGLEKVATVAIAFENRNKMR
jgi:Transposase DNA-binding/Transposase DDE domain